MTRPTIFVAVYRAFSVRYILDSGVLAALREGGARVVVLHPDHESPWLRERFGGDDVSFEPFPLEESQRLLKQHPLQSFFNRIRYFTYGGGETKGGTRELYEGYFGRGRTLARGLAWLLRRSRALRRGLVRLESAFLFGTGAQPLFDRYRPDVLVVSSVGYALDSPIMRLARRNGCRVVSLVHSWDNPSSKGYRGAIPDHALAWNEIMRDELVRLHDLDPAAVSVGGIAHWDPYFQPDALPGREDVLRGLGLDPSRPTIFYAPSGFKHVLTTLDVVEALLRRVAAGELGDAQVVLRLHPNYFTRESGKWAKKIEEDLARVAGFERDHAGRFAVSRPVVLPLGKEYAYPAEDLRAYAGLLKAADVLVTEYSTMLLEACLVDTPVVNVGYHTWRDTGRPMTETIDRFDHLRRILETGAVRQARSEDELVASIAAYLADRGLDRDARRAVLDREVPVNRGTAAEAIAAEVLRIARRTDGDS